MTATPHDIFADVSMPYTKSPLANLLEGILFWRSLRLEGQSETGQHPLVLLLTHPPRLIGVVERHRFLPPLDEPQLVGEKDNH